MDEIELPYNSVCKQKKIHLNFYFQIHATFPPDDRQVGNIDSIKDFFTIMNLEPNGCIIKKDILFTLLIAN